MSSVSKYGLLQEETDFGARIDPFKIQCGSVFFTHGNRFEALRLEFSMESDFERRVIFYSTVLVWKRSFTHTPT